jgi:hypothetical protein
MTKEERKARNNITPGSKNAASALALERMQEDRLESRWADEYCRSKGIDILKLNTFTSYQQSWIMRAKGFTKEAADRTTRVVGEPGVYAHQEGW